MTADPGGVSALRMQKLLGLGSYQTAWAMLHRYRTAMVRPGRELLTGPVEVDETYLGGEQPGPRGRGALGKTLVVIAVELLAPKGYGRARMSVIPDASAETLRPFLLATVEPGTTVVTDGWSAYPNACQDWFLHEPHPVAGSGSQAHELLPAVHLVASLASGGCWAPTRAACSPSTCRPTWTSSASGSTAGTPVPAACSSTGSCSTPPVHRR
jgi:transposase-like protein